MTNINCTSKCLHQKDGKCTLDDISIKNITPTTDCIYFTEKRKTMQ